jgi:hypothetical protein
VSDDKPDYDDPAVERAWIHQQRTFVRDYLAAQRVEATDLPQRPEWLLAPYIALWRVNLMAGSEVWVISGDVPTDYLPPSEAATPRDAALAFAQRWQRAAGNMLAGRRDPEVTIGRPEDQAELGDLLRKRAVSLKDFAGQDALWQS